MRFDPLAIQVQKRENPLRPGSAREGFGCSESLVAAGTLSRPDKESGGEQVRGQYAIRHGAILTDSAPGVNCSVEDEDSHGQPPRPAMLRRFRRHGRSIAPESPSPNLR